MTTKQQQDRPAALHLYELVDEQLALDALVGMEEGEWTPEIEELAQELTAKLVAKADGYCSYYRSVEAACAAMQAEERRLAARRKARENRLARLKAYADAELQRMGRDKVEGSLFTLARQRSKAQVSVECTVDALPPEFVRVVPEERHPDKQALYAALQAGAEVPGVQLVPQFVVRIY
jgi:hypothetical protein